MASQAAESDRKIRGLRQVSQDGNVGDKKHSYLYARVKPYWEKMRDRDIEKNNSRLLDNVIKIEKDMKKTIESSKKANKDIDVGLKPEYHTSVNRKRDFDAINRENGRLFCKLNTLQSTVPTSAECRANY